jgi:hypothetical protein
MMRIGLLRQLTTSASEELRTFATRPGAFAASFDNLPPEERLAIIADLAELARLASTLIELVGDYYRGDE